MTNIPPEGFGLKDRVAFDQLPSTDTRVLHRPTSPVRGVLVE